ncbi:MAG: hypothetical protein KatS3mg068_0110 [Candidatus Sericytochromatia bacterium]|nr:MAG: hypothetical protein KatS3mg068_0110 [Candidatus Sericytochromatia bacterium]
MKTILFVSHNIAAISQLCNLAIVIDKGNKKYFGSLDKAINVYSDILNSQKTSQDFCKSKNQIIIQDYKLEEIETNFFSDYKFTCEILFYSETILEKSYINFVIENFDNTLVFHSRTDVYNIYPNFEKGVYKIKIIIPHLNLKAGIYNFWFRIVNFNKK